MSIHEITSIDVLEHMVALRATGLVQELRLLESHLWAMLARDGLRRLALNSGLPGIRILLGEPPVAVPAGVLYIEKLLHPAVHEKTTKLDLDALVVAGGV